MTGASLEERVTVERSRAPTTTTQDWYQTGSSVQPLYTGPVDDGVNSHGHSDPIDPDLGGMAPHGGFEANKGQLRRGLDTGIPEQDEWRKDYLLQERYDFSGHDSPPETPNELHHNSDIVGVPNNGHDHMAGATEHLNVTDAEVASAKQRFQDEVQKQIDHEAELWKARLEDRIPW